MHNKFQAIIRDLLCKEDGYILQSETTFSNKENHIGNRINSAFLICISGQENPLYNEATDFLLSLASNAEYKLVSTFLLECVKNIQIEINAHSDKNDEMNELVTEIQEYLKTKPSLKDSKFTDMIWNLFFPEGAGVFENSDKMAEQLREHRTVTITQANPNPILDAGKELIFTSNILLGIPNENTDISNLPYSDELKDVLAKTIKEPQQYWYDHPIQIGVEQSANEIIYGISQLDKSLNIEKERNNLSGKATCLLSVSVTHKGLQAIAKDYIQQELSLYGKLENLEVYIFTETETLKLCNDVLIPHAQELVGKEGAQSLIDVLGVDGEYGRHYSFLKAIAAVWNVFIDPSKKATFKIDLDQVFAQDELISETGKSALEHFASPLWGAKAIDSSGKAIELGMIAGALVNEKDIHKGIYTPDVTFPNEISEVDSNFFFSKMLMALSTKGELMTRYNGNNGLDGVTKCIQRIHVTGGTNGILIDALRKHRPFTPSFIGRAEDQCYILSALCNKQKEKLAYYHEDGLIMRHDKEAFAADSLKAAKFGNIVGDYIRLLYFSEYAKVLTNDVESLKNTINPFTGCFVSKIPVTVCMMRYALRASDFFNNNDDETGKQFMDENSHRLKTAIDFILGDNSLLRKQIAHEKLAWDCFYDTLDKLELGIVEKNANAEKAKNRVQAIIQNCKVNNE